MHVIYMLGWHLNRGIIDIRKLISESVEEKKKKWLPYF